MKASDLVSAGPLPLTSVFTDRLLLAFFAGILTTGAAPKPPVTETVGADEAVPEELPQPARTPAASRGRMSMTAIRRMNSSMLGFVWSRPIYQASLVNWQTVPERRQPTGSFPPVVPCLVMTAR